MNWLNIPIAAFCKTGSGGTPLRSKHDRYYVGGYIPWVKSGELKNDVITKTEEYITDEALAESSAKLVPAGAILVAMYGATVGQTSMLGIEAATNQAVCHILPNEQIAFTKYVWYVLRSKLLELLSRRVGGAQPNISQQIIKSTLIPLPPLSEQRRIVEILDQADALRRKQAEAAAKADRILPALFIKMFGDPATWTPITNAKIQRLGSIVNIQSGSTPSKQNSDYWNGNIPWVSAKDMKQDIIIDSIDHISELALKETNIKYVDKGAVLILVRGMILAHTIPIALAGCRLTINQDMKALYPNCFLNDIDSIYIHAALKASTRILLSKIGTAAHGTRKLDTDELLKIPILIPESTKLERFRLNVINCRQILSEMYKTTKTTEKIFEILLKNAFSGEMTAKWREAHMKELLAEMEAQTKAITDIDENEQLSLL